jgi:hypothetical protein
LAIREKVMNHTFRVRVVAGIAMVLLGPSHFCLLAQDEKEKKLGSKEQKVRKLLEITGAASMGKQVMDAMLDQFNKMPNLPEGFIAKFREVATGQDLLEKVIPIYLKHFDEESLDAVIAFYQTDAGRKFIKAQPAIMKESMELGQKWGQELATKALKSLQEDKEKKQGKDPKKDE